MSGHGRGVRGLLHCVSLSLHRSVQATTAYGAHIPSYTQAYELLDLSAYTVLEPFSSFIVAVALSKSAEKNRVSCTSIGGPSYHSKLLPSHVALILLTSTIALAPISHRLHPEDVSLLLADSSEILVSGGTCCSVCGTVPTRNMAHFKLQ